MQDVRDFNALNSLLAAASLEEEERYANEAAAAKRKEQRQQQAAGKDAADAAAVPASASAIIAAGSRAAREGRLAATASASVSSSSSSSSNNNNQDAIWDEAEVDSPHVASLKNSGDSRKRPEYELVYKQSVGSETVYFGMGDMDPSSNCCQDIVLKIQLPGQLYKEIDLDVQIQSLIVSTPEFRLATYLPYKVDHENGSAQWLADKEVLKLTLPIIEE